MTLLDKGKSLEITRHECWFSVTHVSTFFRFANAPVHSFHDTSTIRMTLAASQK